MLAMWLGIAGIACNTRDGSRSAPQQAAGTSTSGAVGITAGGAAGFAGQAPADCTADGVSSRVGLASAILDGSRVHLDPGVELLGAGVPPLLSGQQGPMNGLRWQDGHVFMLLDEGFWDIEPEGPVRWYPAGTTLELGIRGGDLDGDGDQDVMLLSTMEDGMGFVTRLSVWERTPTGLVQRVEVLRSSLLILPMPYDFGDVDGDADLDILTYERGQPVAYVNDGKFGFARSVLGETAPEYVDSLVLVVGLADRNGDGTQDLLVVAGTALAGNVFVLLRDGAGRYALPGPPTAAMAPLVPYGPMGNGIAMADVTGDGIADVVAQDADASKPHIRLTASVDATSLIPPVQIDGLGFEFADIDQDGTLDIVTTMNDRLHALTARGNGPFETRDLGIALSMPDVIDFTTDPGEGGATPRLHVLYKLPCQTCGASCAGRCVFNTCVACLSDDDCATGRCENQACL
jgi:hypothetical protein